MLSISVNKSYTDLLKTIRLHLAVIGKRATNVQGESFFVDLTTSSKEDKIFYDLIDAGSETIVSEISDVCSNYYLEDGVKFVVYNDRWEKGDETYVGDLEDALDAAIGRYLVNFALAQFLSSIFPAVSNESVPMYGRTYIEHCQVILKNIKTLAFLKRPAPNSGTSYGEMLDAGTDPWEDGKIISLLTIKRNGTPLCAYNGLADKTIDILVPTKISELTNDKGFITGIDSEMVVTALGYTPFDEAGFTKGNIQATLGISAWALAEKKPSYSVSEIAGLETILATKYDSANFSTDFATELSKYQLGHKVAKDGTGDYVISLYESGDTIYYKTADFTSAVKAIIGGGGSTNAYWGTKSTSGASRVLTVSTTSETVLLDNGENLGEEWFYKKTLTDGTVVIGTKFGFFSEKGVSAYAYGESSESTIVWTQLVTEGSKIAEIKIGDAEPIEVWAPTSGGGGGTTVSYGYVTSNYVPLIVGSRTENILVSELDPVWTAYKASDEFQNILNICSHLSIVNDTLKADIDFWSEKGISSYGYGGSTEPTIAWSQLVTEGSKIATITIGGVSTDVYAPTGGGSGTTVSYGTETTDYVPLTVGSTTKNISLYGHTHSQYLTSESDPIWTDYKASAEFQNIIAVCSHLSVVDGRLKADTDFWSEKGISAYEYGDSSVQYASFFSDLQDSLIQNPTDYSGKAWGYNGTSWGFVNASGTTYSQGSGITINSDNVISVNDSYASAWNAKYDKPSGGIPNTDLANSSMTLWGGTVSLGGTLNGNMTGVGNVSFIASSIFNFGGIAYFDTVNSRLGVCKASPSYPLDVTGIGHFSGNVLVGSTSSSYVSINAEGGVDIFNSDSPYIDFHYGNNTDDYSARLINSADGVLEITSLSTHAQASLKIGGAYLKYDSTNKALYVDDGNGGGMSFYATGGLAAYSSLSGAGDANLANLTLTTSMTVPKINGSGSSYSQALTISSFSTTISAYGIKLDASSVAITGTLSVASLISANGGIKIGSSGSSITSVALSTSKTTAASTSTPIYITIGGNEYKMYGYLMS